MSQSAALHVPPVSSNDGSRAMRVSPRKKFSAKPKAFFSKDSKPTPENFWKAVKELEQCQEQFETFRNESGEFEEALEAELQHAHEEFAELKAKHEKLQQQFDAHKDSTDSNVQDSNQQVLKLQEELKQANAEKAELLASQRRLEQELDNAQRAQRIAVHERDELKHQLDSEQEAVVLLKDEAQERETALKKEVQELKEKLTASYTSRGSRTDRSLRSFTDRTLDTLGIASVTTIAADESIAERTEEVVSKREAGDRQFFILSAAWLVRWKDYMVGASTSIPGPISNQELLMGSGDPRIGLIPEIDYVCVKTHVWSAFHKMYGGGPVICRSSPDIYGQSINDITLSETSAMISSRPLMQSTELSPRHRPRAPGPASTDDLEDRRSRDILPLKIRRPPATTRALRRPPPDLPMKVVTTPVATPPKPDLEQSDSDGKEDDAEEQRRARHAAAKQRRKKRAGTLTRPTKASLAKQSDRPEESSTVEVSAQTLLKQAKKKKKLATRKKKHGTMTGRRVPSTVR